jgi:hypothetical protein
MAFATPTPTAMIAPMKDCTLSVVPVSSSAAATPHTIAGTTDSTASSACPTDSASAERLSEATGPARMGWFFAAARSASAREASTPGRSCWSTSVRTERANTSSRSTLA